MNRWKLLNDAAPAPRIVLVLQADQALWFRESRPGGGIESFSETIETGDLDVHSHCPWIRSSSDSVMTPIHLVLDSHLDEVDRVRAATLSRGWLRPLQSWRMRKRLRADYPATAIHTLSRNAAPDALSLVHNLLPESWQSWLGRLQKEHVCISHVVSSIELLCQQAQQQQRLRGAPVLFDIPVGEYRRHLLVDAGSPLFMRLVSEESELADAEQDALRQSLTHVRRQLAGVEDVTVVTLASTSKHSFSDTAGLALADLCLARSAESDWVLSDTAMRLEPRTEQDQETESGMRRGVLSACQWFRSRVATPRRRQLQRWQLTRSHRLAGDLLQVSVTRNAMQVRIRQLQRATLICTWMAAAMVIVASVHGVASARERARLSSHHHEVTGQIDQFSSEASSLNSHPAFVVSTMEKIGAHQDMGPIGAAEVLTTVAEALDEFPALRLDDIAWSVMQDEASDAVFTSMNQVPSRESLWQEGTAAAQLQVELGGLVMSQHGVRDQQHTLEAFAAYLQAMPGVSEVTLIQTPVNLARSSQRLSLNESAYRLSLVLGVS